MLSLGVLFDVNYTCILSVFFMYIYHSNVRFTPYSKDI